MRNSEGTLTAVSLTYARRRWFVVPINKKFPGEKCLPGAWLVEARLARHFFEDEMGNGLPGSLGALPWLSEVECVSTSSSLGSAWEPFISYAEAESFGVIWVVFGIWISSDQEVRFQPCLQLFSAELAMGVGFQC